MLIIVLSFINRFVTNYKLLSKYALLSELLLWFDSESGFFKNFYGVF